MLTVLTRVTGNIPTIDLGNFCPVKPAPGFQIARSPSSDTVDRSHFWSRSIVTNELVLDSLSYDGNCLENIG